MHRRNFLNGMVSFMVIPELVACNQPTREGISTRAPETSRDLTPSDFTLAVRRKLSEELGEDESVVQTISLERSSS